MANLLIGRKGDAYIAVLELGIILNILRHCHNFGHARLVVGAQNGRAVRCDYIHTRIVFKGGAVGLAYNRAVAHNYVAARIFYYLGRNAVTLGLAHHVEVGDESHGRRCGRVGGYLCVYIAVFGHARVEPQLLQLCAERLCKVKLAGGGGGVPGVFLVTRRVNFYVF